MKEGWEYKTLGECCDVNYGTRVVRSKVSGSEFPVYGGGGETFRINCYNRENCLVVARFAMSKQCTRYVNGKFFLNDSGLTVSPKKDSCLTKELLEKYLLANNDLIYSFGRGSAQRNLNMSEFRSMLISFPIDNNEQRRIVSYLDSSFKLIDEIKNKALKSLTEAKALFQSALAEATEPKEGWEEKTLKEIGLTQTGTTPSKSNKAYYGNYIPFIRPSEINIDGLGTIEYNSEIMLSQKGIEAGRKFTKKSILMVCIGATIGKVGYSERDISCNQQINVLSPYNGYNYKYLYYAMSSSVFQKKVIKEGTSAQATLPIINKGKWGKLSLYIPPLSTQKRIVSHLDKLSSKVRAIEEKYQKIVEECDALKQAMLRDVFE